VDREERILHENSPVALNPTAFLRGIEHSCGLRLATGFVLGKQSCGHRTPDSVPTKRSSIDVFQREEKQRKKRIEASVERYNTDEITSVEHSNMDKKGHHEQFSLKHAVSLNIP
jgi:hypothetical protein